MYSSACSSSSYGASTPTSSPWTSPPRKSSRKSMTICRLLHSHLEAACVTGLKWSAVQEESTPGCTICCTSGLPIRAILRSWDKRMATKSSQMRCWREASSYKRGMKRVKSPYPTHRCKNHIQHGPLNNKGEQAAGRHCWGRAHAVRHLPPMQRWNEG